MRVVGYCRTSTEGQCGEDKFGIEAQKQSIIGYCQEHDMEIVEWFIDEAVSGASLNPPAFNAILNGGIKNPPIEAVVVAKADRVARDIEKYFGFKFLLKRQDISLISVQEDFGSAGIFAPIYEAISAVFAQMEREFITQRMSGGRRAKAATGGYSGGKAPDRACRGRGCHHARHLRFGGVCSGDRRGGAGRVSFHVRHVSIERRRDQKAGGA